MRTKYVEHTAGQVIQRLKEKAPCANQDEKPGEKPNLDFKHLNLWGEKNQFCYLNHTVCDTLLWEPHQPKGTRKEVSKKTALESQLCQGEKKGGHIPA